MSVNNIHHVSSLMTDPYLQLEADTDLSPKRQALTPRYDCDLSDQDRQV